MAENVGGERGLVLDSTPTPFQHAVLLLERAKTRARDTKRNKYLEVSSLLLYLLLPVCQPPPGAGMSVARRVPALFSNDSVAGVLIVFSSVTANLQARVSARTHRTRKKRTDRPRNEGKGQVQEIAQERYPQEPVTDDPKK